MTGRTRIAFHGALATLAAASALGAVFDGIGWLFPVAGGIAVVAGVSELVRWSPLPSAISPLLAAAGVTGYVTALYARADAYGGVVPSGSSLHVLATTARRGFHDIRTLGTPVPTHKGLVLIAIVGIAAVALVVDLFAVTMRHAALAGLPLLAIFALCTSVAKGGVGWVPFVIGAVGYLWLLLADSRERLVRWGRPMGFEREGRPHFTWSDQEVMPSPLSVMGRRIGLSAVAVGVVVPLLIPGLHGGVSHGRGNGFGLGHGSSSRFTFNPIVTIRGSLTTARSQPVLTVHSTDPEPGYLRMTALDNFDGSSFSPSTLIAPVQAEVNRGLNAPTVNGPRRDIEVQVSGLSVPWLPLPTQVTAVSVSGDWRYDAPSNTVFSARETTAGQHYSAEFVRPQPTAQQLEQATASDPSLAHYLELPAMPNGVRELTARVIGKALTPFDRAVAIQRFLTSPPFVYDISVPADDSTDALAHFLLTTHRGFCQQYAAAMAVMARLAHIPSRVAVGFTRGEHQPDGSWLVSTHDAHAWPELYFNGYGWLPFEPTPRADGQAVAPTYTEVPNTPPAGGATGNNPSPKGGGKVDTPAGSSKNEHLDHELAAVHDLGKRAAGPAAHPNTARRLTGLILVDLVALVLILPSILRVIERRRRWRGARTPAERAGAAWAELRATAIDARAGWVDGLTPRATARVLRAEATGLTTADVTALDRLVVAVQRAWYAPDHAPRGTDGLEADVETLRVALYAEATFGERFVMRAWPRSTLRSAREALSRVGEVLDALDLAGARLRAKLRPRAAASPG